MKVISLKKVSLFLALWFCLLALIWTYTVELDIEITPIEITAEDLWRAFKYDQTAAKEKYDDKLISVTGTIAEGPAEFMQEMCILLENGERSIPDGIFCMFPIEKDLSSYHVGQKVTIVGRCSLAIHIAGDDTNPYISILDAEIK